MKKSFGFPILFMAILTAVFTFVLSFLNFSTADRVEFNEKTELREKILYTFDIDAPTDDPEATAKIFDEKIEEIKVSNGEEDENPIYIHKENGETIGYAIPVRGSGLWGSILGYVGIKEDYSEIIGVEFINHSETPGLGGRIDELEYKEQFRGIKLEDPNGEFIIYNPAPGGNVDAISGATLTSKAVTEIINKDLNEFLEDGEVE